MHTCQLNVSELSHPGGRDVRVSDCAAQCGSGVSILVGGEEAGATLPFGCRMGICQPLLHLFGADIKTAETERLR